MKLAAAGQVDAGLASLASFALQIFAVRMFTPEQLGAFGLVFAAVVVAGQVPSQLLLSPIEVFSLEVPERDRVGVLRRSLPVGAIAGLPLALAVPFGAVPIASETSREFLIVLGSTAALATVVSPLQDHLRRILHLSDRSHHAAAVSAVQLVVAIVSLFAIAGFSVAAAPFGALIVANTTSIAFGYVLSGARRVESPQRTSFRRTWTVGRWLVLDSISEGLVQYATFAFIASALGAATMGAIEGARVIARPIQVASQGLVAIVSPRSMGAAQQLDRRLAGAWRLRFVILLAVPVSLYSALLSLEVSRSWFAQLLPNSFLVPHLASAAVVAVTFGALAHPFVSELSGALRQSRLVLWSVVSGTVLLAAAWAFVRIGPFVFPVAIAASGITKTLGLWVSADRIYRKGVENRSRATIM